MKVEIHHIPSHGLDLSFEEQSRRFVSLKSLEDNGECEFVSPVAIELHLMPMPDFIRVQGRIEITVRQACVRCLESFKNRIKSGFTLNYSKEIPADLHHNDKAGIELTAQQIGMIFYAGDEIDFADALQEQVVLALPYQPICREDCKGLCPQCGQDLNQKVCKCGNEAADGPFAALKDLKLPSK
jgi:uncharacterized protein